MKVNLISPDELINSLEANGEISIINGTNELFIQNVDDKEGYSYVSSTNEEFGSSREAVEWAIKKMNGINNIVTWE
jgi:3-isopropylmalate dehydratase small subunit